MLLIYAFGGTKNINLRNFARSYFCLFIIGVVIFIIFFVIYGTTYIDNYNVPNAI